MQGFQFFPPRLVKLPEQEMAAHKHIIDIPEVVRDPSSEKDIADKLEEERNAAQEFIDDSPVEPLTEEQLREKEELTAQGFEFWSWRDFQQFVRAPETHGWTDDYELLASEIQDKTADDVAEYFPVFKKRWKELSEYPRVKLRIEEGEAERSRRSNLEALLSKKIASVKYPMHELELNYSTTKGDMYSEEQDRYLLCRLNHYGMHAGDVYEHIKKDIATLPVFMFDWFFRSRSPQELQRRCNALLGMIQMESEGEQAEQAKTKGAKGKNRGIEQVKEEDEAEAS